MSRGEMVFRDAASWDICDLCENGDGALREAGEERTLREEL